MLATATPLPDDIRLTHRATRWVVVALLALLLGHALGWAVRHPVFAWRGVRLEGDLARNSEPTLRANALPQLQGNFFTLDLAAARKAFESVPWVRKAVVRRLWPGWLVVRLEEHRPVAVWLDDGGNQRLVNQQGELFEVDGNELDESELERFPVFSGPPAAAALMLQMQNRINVALRPLGHALVELHLSDRGLWEVTLDDGRDLVLGRGPTDEVLARLGLFVRSISAAEARRQGQWLHADLRHPQGFAVRLRDTRAAERRTAPAVNKN